MFEVIMACAAAFAATMLLLCLRQAIQKVAGDKKRIEMIKTILKIDGMMCSMCESHVNDRIRSCFIVDSVKSSHSKGETVIISRAPLDVDNVISKLAEMGYTVTSSSIESCEKSSLIVRLFRKK